MPGEREEVGGPAQPVAGAEGEYVFVSPRRGKPYTRDGFSSIWKRAIARAGVEDFTPHDLRHTYATRLRQRRVPIEVVSKLLGHADLTTTMRYAHVDMPELHEAVAVLPRPLDQAH